MSYMENRKPRRARQTFTFQVEAETLGLLDKLRTRESSPPSRGAMINRIVQWVAEATLEDKGAR